MLDGFRVYYHCCFVSALVLSVFVTTLIIWSFALLKTATCVSAAVLSALDAFGGPTISGNGYDPGQDYVLLVGPGAQLITTEHWTFYLWLYATGHMVGVTIGQMVLTYTRTVVDVAERSLLRPLTTKWGMVALLALAEVVGVACGGVLCSYVEYPCEVLSSGVVKCLWSRPPAFHHWSHFVVLFSVVLALTCVGPYAYFAFRPLKSVADEIDRLELKEMRFSAARLILSLLLEFVVFLLIPVFVIASESLLPIPVNPTLNTIAYMSIAFFGTLHIIMIGFSTGGLVQFARRRFCCFPKSSFQFRKNKVFVIAATSNPSAPSNKNTRKDS